MTEQEHDRLSRENAYLKLRCAQLQEANDDLLASSCGCNSSWSACMTGASRVRRTLGGQ
jgi:hypothetical protein